MTFRIVTHGEEAYLELDATEAPDGSLVVDKARWQNLTTKTLNIELRRANGSAIINRSIGPGTILTEFNVTGSPTSKTLLGASSTLN